MKSFYKYLYCLCLITAITGCDKDFEEINTNNNDPLVVPTNTIFNGATKDLMSNTRGATTSGLTSLLITQYVGQPTNNIQDRYDFDDITNGNLWESFYLTANNFKTIIDFNTQPNTKNSQKLVLDHGSNNNQIAVSRIMLSYIFHQLVDIYGDIPYYSYGNPKPEFQALEGLKNLSPSFADQNTIYKDILKELREAADQLETNTSVFEQGGDNIYNGNTSKWRKLANSLILRIANRYKTVDETLANEAIITALASGVFESNDDNAIQAFEVSSETGNQLFVDFIKNPLSNLVVTNNFINLLKGQIGFSLDPRLYKFAAPTFARKASILEDSKYADVDGFDVEIGFPEDYIGIPYGYDEGNNDISLFFRDLYSELSLEVLSPNNGEVIMEYAEVAFILSELDNWDQSLYEKGITASMQRWGINNEEIISFINTLPPANEETVLTQKYISLFMQPWESWSEYRRTGFPSTLILPGEEAEHDFIQIDDVFAFEGIELDPTYIFQPSVEIDDIPSRLTYPNSTQSSNSENRAKAVAKLNNGDQLDSKLIWDKN